MISGMNRPSVRILAIESSCDETAAAVVVDGRRILSNVVASQIELHQQFGGVFPELASRQHVVVISAVIKEAMQKAHLNYNELDAVAVTRGPGLAGSLVVGINAAKGLSLATGKPLIGVNHLEGHIYSAWLLNEGEDTAAEPEFPLIVLLVSGGHSEIVFVRDHLRYERLGGTLDDAAGEAFDKSARLIGLPYPGGPSIQAAAKGGNPAAFRFPRAKLDNPFDFSFSGLKTSVLRTVQGLSAATEEGKEAKLPIADLAASFQRTIADTLFRKTIEAAKIKRAKAIVVAGGVSANAEVRALFESQRDFPVFIPKLKYCTDNAAMIGAAGYQRYQKKLFEAEDFDVLPTWPLSRVSIA